MDTTRVKPFNRNRQRNRRKIMFPTISDIFRVICNEIELEEWKKGEKK